MQKVFLIKYSQHPGILASLWSQPRNHRRTPLIASPLSFLPSSLTYRTSSSFLSTRRYHQFYRRSLILPLEKVPRPTPPGSEVGASKLPAPLSDSESQSWSKCIPRKYQQVSTWSQQDNNNTLDGPAGDSQKPGLTTRGSVHGPLRHPVLRDELKETSNIPWQRMPIKSTLMLAQRFSALPSNQGAIFDSILVNLSYIIPVARRTDQAVDDYDPLSVLGQREGFSV
ncbi:hypothetical protein EVAR_29414_1 [Eumeta japonica]|uniref:Uncharacterized protein n=1 Tax=Eumeta variegata TaxID=151549 RepID=A0A4C1VV24_EUMVA|nr:hypothetical protein EVAR_29414_1 [Eumeta japonica]